MSTKQSTDIEVARNGGIVMLIPATARGAAWLRDNVAAEAWQYTSGALAVEHRYAQDIIDGAAGAGLEVAC